MSYKETMIKKFGSEELWKEHLSTIGSKGGKNGTGYEYAHGKADPAVSGAKGGRISKRRPKADIMEENK